MEQSSINANEIAVGSLLAGRMNGGGYGGGGGAWGGGGRGGYGMYGSPGMNAVRIDRNAQEIENQADHTRDQIHEAAHTIENSFENATRSSEFGAIKDGQFRAELRQTDRARDLAMALSDISAATAKCCCETQASIAQAAKEAAECCCAAKLQQCKDTADIKALILEENGKTRDMINSNALDAANARITQLETINALSSQGHH
jgi:hypothetical protein